MRSCVAVERSGGLEIRLTGRKKKEWKKRRRRRRRKGNLIPVSRSEVYTRKGLPVRGLWFSLRVLRLLTDLRTYACHSGARAARSQTFCSLLRGLTALTRSYYIIPTLLILINLISLGDACAPRRGHGSAADEEPKDRFRSRGEVSDAVGDACCSNGCTRVGNAKRIAAERRRRRRRRMHRA